MPLVDLLSALIIVAIIGWVVNTRLPATGSIKLIVNVVIALLVVGMVLWLINSYIPMAGSIKAILNIVVVVATCVGVLQAVGLWGEVVKLWSNLRYRTSH